MGPKDFKVLSKLETTHITAKKKGQLLDKSETKPQRGYNTLGISN